MSDLRKQVHEHYDAQSLPSDKVAAILAKGRAAAAGEENRTVEFASARTPRRTAVSRWGTVIAAVIVLSLTGVWWTRQHDRTTTVPFAAIAPRVIEFFAHEPDLMPPMQDKKQLHAFLVSKGAPADFEIPSPLMGLESAACDVVMVDKTPTYLSCYWRENLPGRGQHELIHLLVGRASDFSGPPATEKPVMSEKDGWTFAAWTRNDAVYLLATAAPPEKMMPFLSMVDRLDSAPAFHTPRPEPSGKRIRSVDGVGAHEAVPIRNILPGFN